MSTSPFNSKALPGADTHRPHASRFVSLYVHWSCLFRRLCFLVAFHPLYFLNFIFSTLGYHCLRSMLIILCFCDEYMSTSNWWAIFLTFDTFKSEVFYRYVWVVIFVKKQVSECSECLFNSHHTSWWLWVWELLPRYMCACVCTCMCLFVCLFSQAFYGVDMTSKLY